MKRIYFDNSSTSFPKAPGVSNAVKEMIDNGCYNINRGGYSEAYALENVVYDTREMICNLFNFDEPSNVIFTPSITYSLNFIIKGFFKKGDHVIVSSIEHNAMMRPLMQMKDCGVIDVDIADCNKDGSLDINILESMIKEETKAIMMLHGSNVCGTLLPIEDVGKICKKHNIKFIVDSAQTAGVFPIDMKKMNIDALCFTGHKGLRGPQGIGGFLVSDEMAKEINPVISGGTGSFSHIEKMPYQLPDKFEPGTLNLPGIVGLHAALEYLNKQGIENTLKEELLLAKRFYDGVQTIDGVKAVGKSDFSSRAPIVSLDFLTMDNAEVAFNLESNYGIMTRCGLHCAPRAHKTLGTFPQGTVRFSFSQFNTKEEVDFCLNAIKEILK